MGATMKWTDVPGMLDEAEGAAIQEAVRLCKPGTAHVELGAWCGRSLAAACEALPVGVTANSYDNYLTGSQTEESGGAGKTLTEARKSRIEVANHYRLIIDAKVVLWDEESSKGGVAYTGSPVASLFIDDHHSSEQVEANLQAWLPHLSSECSILFHDYWTLAYGIFNVAERILPSHGFQFFGRRFGLGVWKRPAVTTETAMPTISVVIPCQPSAYGPLSRCLSILDKSICDEIIITRFDATHLAVKHELPVREIGVAYVPDIARELVRRAFEAATSDWVFLLFPEEWAASGKETLRASLAAVPKDNAVVACHVVEVEDVTAKVQRNASPQSRLVRRSASFQFHENGFGAAELIAPVAIAAQPLSAFYYEVGDTHSALRLTEGSMDPIDERYRTMARSKLDTRKGLQGLWALFEHMSNHEELWRLGEILKYLPYTLEDDPSVAEMKKAYAQQMGHLDGGAERWYADGSYSPAHGVDAAYVELGAKAMPQRCKWLVEECRKWKFKRLLELGSTDGNNLFPMARAAPDLDITGVEVNELAVEHARALSAQTGVKINIHHAPSFQVFADERDRRGLGLFDAVAVFEVLEHNSPEEGSALLDAADRCVRPSGRVFITTPCGSWSCHDPACWDLKQRKDHINAYTVKRMEEFLSNRRVKDLQVERVENPQYKEANAWVFASYEI